jgi:uncharacterized RDD family membrane protein YckC
MTQPDNLRDPFAPPGPGSMVPGPAVQAQPTPGGWAPVATTHVVPQAALATPWLRLGAALLNTLLVVVTLGIGYLVWTLVLWSEGTNPGKKICGLRVVKADTGRTCTFGDMLVRSLVMGSLVLGIIGTVTLGLGYLVDALMIFGERRQRLVDRMSGTLVVQV